ncbi:TfuA-like protein [Lysobacter silvisoli]|uniref:TfuA-like core domain-containing protein n=1 Tax=Lysobacter silvisoli TaxID=2293254 RepID=A0A371K409_9GAMM|nr:TfuA-like protein [Lysobacter silvisoli]RDZ28618.1 hypothetical protein DX914_05695 [Lysobacter silvisoli]
MATYVYLGPSLPRDQAERILPAEYLDPIAMGDLYTLVRTRARRGDRVAIVDGFFEQVPAVWHKEILYAIEQGIAVYGASSMGALRAAELHGFGMRGLGRVFEAYRDLVIEDDDEVAVAHATQEEGYRSLSTAMVSLRFGLDGLRQAGRISAEQHDRLCAYAKSQHYNVRSWADTYAYALGLGLGEDVLAALRDVAAEPDAKAQDAVALLRHLAALEDGADEPREPGFVLEQTGLWRDLTQSQEARVASESLQAALSSAPIDAEVVEHARAASPLRDALLREALLMKIARESRAAAPPGAQDLKAAVFRIAAKNGLRSSEDLRAWRAQQGLSDADWLALLQMDARVQQLSLQAMAGVDAYLLAALKANGRYADAVANVAAIRQRYGETWLKQLSAEDFGIGYPDLQRWYEHRYGPMLPDPETHAQALGFQGLSGFVTHVLGEYLLAQGIEEGAAASGEPMH